MAAAEGEDPSTAVTADDVAKMKAATKGELSSAVDGTVAAEKEKMSAANASKLAALTDAEVARQLQEKMKELEALGADERCLVVQVSDRLQSLLL